MRVRSGEQEYIRDWGEWGIVCGVEWVDGGEFGRLGWRAKAAAELPHSKFADLEIGHYMG